MLFTPYQMAGVRLKNRIVMAPMCTYSCPTEDGMVQDWHLIHYGARAMGQVGMIIVEATAVAPAGRISVNDLGLWGNQHIPGMARLAETIKELGAVAAIQLNHAGRKAGVGPALAPSPLPFAPDSAVPQEMSAQQIAQTIADFQSAALRASKAGFEVIEIHAAHGYLLNQFLSPLANRRSDGYGGSQGKRARLLHEVVDAVKAVWQGPLLVRMSLEEYHPHGNRPQDYVEVVRALKEQGVALLDCSSGAVVPADIPTYPGYQVPLAEHFRRETGIATGAVGLITSPLQAEEIIANQRADLVLLGRELLRNPNWPLYAAKELKAQVDIPVPYKRAW